MRDHCHDRAGMDHGKSRVTSPESYNVWPSLSDHRDHKSYDRQGTTHSRHFAFRTPENSRIPLTFRSISGNDPPRIDFPSRNSQSLWMFKKFEERFSRNVSLSYPLIFKASFFQVRKKREIPWNSRKANVSVSVKTRSVRRLTSRNCGSRKNVNNEKLILKVKSRGAVARWWNERGFHVT